jgi:hypothetical protein
MIGVWKKYFITLLQQRQDYVCLPYHALKMSFVHAYIIAFNWSPRQIGSLRLTG